LSCRCSIVVVDVVVLVVVLPVVLPVVIAIVAFVVIHVVVVFCFCPLYLSAVLWVVMCSLFLLSLFVVISVTVCCCSGLCGSSFSSHSWSLLVGLGGLEPSQHSFVDEKSRQFPLSLVLNRVFSPTLLGTFSVFFPTHLGTLLACFYFLAI